MSGETECGDDFAVRQGPGFLTVMLVDGLGHGPLAADCAAAAVDAFRESDTDSPAELMQEIHGALRSTRGAAVAIAHFDDARHQVRFAGIGNVEGVIARDGGLHHLVSHPGIVGHNVHNVREISYRLGENVLALLYSDGISTHWSLDAYEGLMSRAPSLIASVIYRDHSRRRDDATVVVLSESSAA